MMAFRIAWFKVRALAFYAAISTGSQKGASTA